MRITDRRAGWRNLPRAGEALLAVAQIAVDIAELPPGGLEYEEAIYMLIQRLKFFRVDPPYSTEYDLAYGQGFM
jgi:hypothetical protein